VRAEIGVETCDALYRCADGLGDGHPSPLGVGERPAVTAAKADRTRELLCEQIDLSTCFRGSFRVGPGVGLIYLRGQLAKALSISRFGSLIEDLPRVACLMESDWLRTGQVQCVELTPRLGDEAGQVPETHAVTEADDLGPVVHGPEIAIAM
jgi:hypothetical protein